MGMKLLVVSDSHHRTERLKFAFDQCKPDAVLHLGDNIIDAYELRWQVSGTVLYMVKGNCDYQDCEESELLLCIEGVKIFMSHGHGYGVKKGLNALIHAARKKGADLALYGHTHLAQIREMPGLTLMNPGQMERHDDLRTASYGIVNIDSGKFACDIVYLPR